MNLASIYAKRSAIIKARKAKRLEKSKELAADTIMSAWNGDVGLDPYARQSPKPSPPGTVAPSPTRSTPASRKLIDR